MAKTKPRSEKSINSLRKLSKPQAVLFAGLAAILGILVIQYIFAAGAPVSFEAESGAIKAPAAVSAITGASGGSGLKFGPAALPTPTASVVPTPSVPPTGSRTCPAYPAFPDANCTGVTPGIVLKASGSVTVTTANTVIQNMDITGSISVNAANVTIKNCKIHGGAGPGIKVNSGNVIVMDTEIFDMGNTAIGFSRWEGYRLNIHDMHDDGIKVGNNTTLVDSFIHDFKPAAGAHSDGGQMQSGSSNLVVRHNYINVANGTIFGNSALILKPDLSGGGTGPVTVDKNLLGGGNFSLFIVPGSSGFHQTGYVITNNHFLRNQRYGTKSITEPASAFTTWSGNVYDDNNQVISL